METEVKSLESKIKNDQNVLVQKELEIKSEKSNLENDRKNYTMKLKIWGTVDLELKKEQKLA